MKTLKKPAVATILSLLMVVLSTLISAETKLQAEADKISMTFYDGVTYDGYKHASISSQLDIITGAADGIASIVPDYGVDAAELSDYSRYLKSSISYADYWFGSVYYDYEQLCDELTTIERKTRNIEFTERDAAGMEKYWNTIENASRLIDEAGYNEYVRNYLNNLSATEKFFVYNCDVYIPQYFA